VTTPREQLIEVIAEEAHKVRWGHKTGEHIGCNGIDMNDYSIASLSLHRLKEMGAVVIMPIGDPARAQLVDGQTVFHRHTHLGGVGQPDYANYYVDALAGES
jgi:hypothetical protein